MSQCHPIDESRESSKKLRNSNLELYRIICMLMIVAHHYVVNSGLTFEGGPLLNDNWSSNSVFLTLFGAWGKTGINCFLMITGYYMCTSHITIRKLLKLLLQIYFYKLIIYILFLIGGYELMSVGRIVNLLMPFWGIKDDFVGCFLVFYLTIPFWNILIKNMTGRQHLLLLSLLLVSYSLLGSINSFNVTFNYVTWFGVIYLLASYIRLNPISLFEKRSVWGLLSFLFLLLGMISILGCRVLRIGSIGTGYDFVEDCNKIFAVAIAVCSFLWFKNMNIKYCKFINAFGAGTFGVLLIHANSNAMRTWLWKDMVDVVGNYSLPIGLLVLYSFGVVFAIFVICNIIDQLRIATLEKCLFNLYDSKLSAKADKIINKIISI